MLPLFCKVCTIATSSGVLTSLLALTVPSLHPLLRSVPKTNSRIPTAKKEKKSTLGFSAVTALRFRVSGWELVLLKLNNLNLQTGGSLPLSTCCHGTGKLLRESVL